MTTQRSSLRAPYLYTIVMIQVLIATHLVTTGEAGQIKVQISQPSCPSTLNQLSCTAFWYCFVSTTSPIPKSFS